MSEDCEMKGNHFDDKESAQIIPITKTVKVGKFISQILRNSGI
jgi:RNA:NAD 2'-phosphotransferase (TPT1/KptA family)